MNCKGTLLVRQNRPKTFPRGLVSETANPTTVNYREHFTPDNFQKTTYIYEEITAGDRDRGREVRI